jgi:GntR family transcriptional regulator/MocR family aminotransferase
MKDQTEPKREPAYLRLYRRLRERITEGAYPFGGKLPSKRVLAADAGVSVVTAEHALAILCDEGYLEARQRSGYFVVYSESEVFVPAEEEAFPAAPPLPEGGRAAAGQAFPFSVLARTMRRVLSERGESLLIKSPNDGCPELRRAVAAYLLRSRGMAVGPSQIVVGSGAEYLYSQCVALFGRDKVFGIEDPSYEKIRRVYQASGAVCEPLRLGRGGIRSDELERSRADVLHVTPFRSFPSGVTASASKRREYLRWAEERDAWIVEDDFDSEFAPSGKAVDTVFSLDRGGRVVYMNTFSKTVAPSIRVGYMVLPPELLERYRRRIGFCSCTVPIFEQYVLAELLQSGDFERHVNRVRRFLRRAQENGKEVG